MSWNEEKQKWLCEDCGKETYGPMPLCETCDSAHCSECFKKWGCSLDID